MSRVVALALVLSAGCAVMFQDRPSSDGHMQPCAPSKLWIADAAGVAAGVAAIFVGALVVKDNAGEVTSGVGAVGGVLYLASMGNGLRWNRQCHGG